MQTFRARFQVGVSLALIAVALSGCSGSDALKEDPEATRSSKSPSATPTSSATADSADVDRLPLMDGAVSGLPEGWTTSTCDDLSYPIPPSWTPSAEGNGLFGHTVESPSAVPAKAGFGGAAQGLVVYCEGETSDWNGSWDAEGATSWRVEVPGAKFAAAYSQVVPATDHFTPEAVAPDDEIVAGEFQILGSNDIYYQIQFLLPVGDPNNEVLLQTIAGNLTLS